jgi:hypothetical protein
MTTLLLLLLGSGVQTQAPACARRGDAQALAARASPLDSAQVTIAGAVLKVCYGRPSVRGRPVAGGLVPYGQTWRLGANEPTTVHVPFAAEIGSVQVEPGSYSLYVVASERTWDVHVNRSVDRWGIPIDAAVQAQDVGKATVPVEQLASPVEMLTLSLAPPSGNGTELVVEWEKLKVRIPIRRVQR